MFHVPKSSLTLSRPGKKQQQLVRLQTAPRGARPSPEQIEAVRKVLKNAAAAANSRRPQFKEAAEKTQAVEADRRLKVTQEFERQHLNEKVIAWRTGVSGGRE
jgi:hypothetical protein